MFKILTLATALTGAFWLCLAAVPPASAMPSLKFGVPATSAEATQIRYGGHGLRGFRGGRHLGRNHFGGHHRHHYGYSPYYSYGYVPRYYSHGSYYRPYYPHRYYGYSGYSGYGRGYGW